MKRLGIGYEDYKRFVDEDLYFVDKTMLIKEVLEKGGLVTLFTRPRRFGKTLALSMLRTFFELEYDLHGNIVEKGRYFQEKKVWDAGEEVMRHMGQYPVIHMSLKSAKQTDFYSAFLCLREEIIREYDRHRYVLDADRLSKEKKIEYQNYLSGITQWEEKLANARSKEEKEDVFRKEVAKYATALRFLSECLFMHHDKKVIILLDEYDVPLETAYYQGFYREMVGFIRSLLESALKTNEVLERAMITGCLRISRESIFTGLNHLSIVSIRSENFAGGFGFTQRETEEFLAAYGLESKTGEVMQWYDGYLFGDTEIYNPWSLVLYIEKHIANPDALPEPYWPNTSSNTIIRDLVEKADAETKKELEELIAGGTVEKRIHEDITYEDIYESDDNLWNFLFFTGYMKKVSERREGRDIYMTLKIPNDEICSIYENQIRTWFDRVVKSTSKDGIHRAVLEGDAEKLAELLTKMLKKTISTFDSAESFYHGFFLSTMYGVEDYAPQSNREEGDGRPDVVLYPENPKDPAILFELKIRKKFSEMDDGIREAFTQIRDKRYEEGILEDGYAGVVSYGVCFCKKSCIIEKMPS